MFNVHVYFTQLCHLMFDRLESHECNRLTHVHNQRYDIQSYIKLDLVISFVEDTGGSSSSGVLYTKGKRILFIQHCLYDSCHPKCFTHIRELFIHFIASGGKLCMQPQFPSGFRLTEAAHTVHEDSEIPKLCDEDGWTEHAEYVQENDNKKFNF